MLAGFRVMSCAMFDVAMFPVAPRSYDAWCVSEYPDPGPSPIIAPPPGLGWQCSDYAHMASPEERIRWQLSQLELDQFVRCIVWEVEHRCFKDCELWAYLEDKVHCAKRYDVMKAIEERAARDLEALLGLCGGAIHVERSPLGVHGEKHRVLVPLRVAVRMFQVANVKHFVQFGTVRCSMSEQPPTIAGIEAWRTRACPDGWRVWGERGTRENNKAVMEVKAVELGLDYTKEETRLELERLESCTEDTARKMLATWARVLESTKQAQMQNENTEQWPPGHMRPWRFKTLWQMPVVFWIVKLPTDDMVYWQR